MAHVAKYKKDTVKELVDLLKEYPIVGSVNLEGLPTPQLQDMRATLRKDVVLKVSKRRLIKLALEQCGVEGADKLIEKLRGMPALLFTKENPFKLFKKLKENKSAAPAKAGQVAPKDIIVPAGPTPFAPGPVIGELGSVGIKTGVENGKIAIKEDSTVAKEGDKITQKLAELLTRLNILPMEVGLDLVATLENGIIYDKKILDIDEDKFMEDINNACSWALNLSVEVGYPTKDNVELMISKSFREAKAVALEANIIADGIVGDVLAKAEAQMSSLKNTIKI